MPTIFDAITEMNNLWEAWNLVARKKSAPGLDRASVPSFGRHPEANLRRLRCELRDGSYRPAPLRGVWVPKPDGNWRPCGTPAVRDRVAQRAFLNVVVPIVDGRFFNGSHAYRPARSIHTAIAQVEWARDRGQKWVIESDVEKCFESISRPRALAALAAQLGDERAITLAALWLENATDWGLGPVKSERGITQGDLISPFVCNVFLDRFDSALLERGFRPVRCATPMIFVVPLRRRQRADQALEEASAALGELSLAIAHRKTRLTSFEAGFDFLGTLFVGSLTMPRYRIETAKGKARWTAGYEVKTVPAHPPRPRASHAAFLV